MPPRKKADPIADRLGRQALPAAPGFYDRTEEPASPQADTPAHPHDSMAANGQDGVTAGQAAGRLVKRTYYLPEDAVLALERLQLEDRLRTGKRPDLSDLVVEGIGLLVANRRDGKTA
jgi:hypothetical protein